MTPVPLPKNNPQCLGHSAAEKWFLERVQSNTIPHAILIQGMKGVGKATFAFRMARYVLFHGKSLPKDSESMAIPEDSGVFRRVASGGHGDLLVLQRQTNKEGNLVSFITVDDTRQAIQFLRKTPMENGWRVVIVDTGDDLNKNAANALLKILEEPPAHCLLLILSEMPMRLPATLRSRCAVLKLSAPSPEISADIIRPHVIEADSKVLLKLAHNAPGLAILLHQQGGSRVYRLLLTFLKLVWQHQGIRALSILQKEFDKEPERFELWLRLLQQFMAVIIEDRTEQITLEALPEEQEVLKLAKQLPIAQLAQVWQSLGTFLRDADVFNLDWRQVTEAIVYILEGRTNNYV